jgi:hypothetical protein
MDDQPVTRAVLLEALAAQGEQQNQQLAKALAAQKRELIEALATKQELAAQKQEILDEVKVMIAEAGDRTQEAIRDAQTEILKAFLPAQESNTIRFRKYETTLANTDAAITERMAVLERRLWEIEKKLLLHPPAA